MKLKDLRIVKEFLREEGATNVEHEVGKHVKIRYVVGGKQYLQVMAASPSCHRWLKNFKMEFYRRTRQVMPA